MAHRDNRIAEEDVDKILCPFIPTKSKMSVECFGAKRVLMHKI